MNLDSEISNLNTKLVNIKTHKDVPYFNFKNNTFIAKPCNVYDGDTCSVIFDFKGDLIKYRCRCYGYDTPEMRPSRKNPNRDHEKKLAYSAKNRIIELLEAHPSKLIKIECLDFDKYGWIWTDMVRSNWILLVAFVLASIFFGALVLFFMICSCRILDFSSFSICFLILDILRLVLESNSALYNC